MTPKRASVKFRIQEKMAKDRAVRPVKKMVSE
jgi:hypothetical protein